MKDPKISIVLSAIRTQWWQEFISSLENNKISYEIIFVGNKRPSYRDYCFSELNENKILWLYSPTCPAECYNIGFNCARGELINWSADDCTYSEGALDKAYDFYRSFNDTKKVIAFNCIENGSPTSHGHRLDKSDSPLMAPIGMMNRKLLLKLGGYDKNFYCGQSENDIAMRVYELGGSVEICKEAIVEIEHNKKHKGKSIFRTEDGFPYHQRDRDYLMKCWKNENGTISKHRLIKFELFVEENK